VSAPVLGGMALSVGPEDRHKNRGMYDSYLDAPK